MPSPDVSDPLKAQPNFVTTLQQILDNLKTRRYFLSYLEGNYKCPISDKSKAKAREKIGKMHINFDPYCFKEAQDEAYMLLEGEVAGFLSSNYHLRHQLDLLSYSSPTLPDMLFSQAAFPYFVEFLDQKGGRPLLEFWMMASNFREQLQSASAPSSPTDTTLDNCSHDTSKTPRNESLSVQNQEDAMVIYDKYFSLQASQKLGFSDELRCFVESNICQEQGPDADCFDVAVRIVLYVLQTCFLPDYLSSTLYDGYISDLLASVKHTAGDDHKTRLEQAYSVAAAIVGDVTRVTLDARNTPASPYHPTDPYDLANLRHPQHPLTSSSSKPNNNTNVSDDFVPPLLYSEYFKPLIVRGSNSNLSIASSTSDLPQSSSSVSSPAKSSLVSMRKSSSNYNFSDITDGLFGSGSHGLAHSYSLASFDLETDVDADFPALPTEPELQLRKNSKI
ncbi:hypothetical protein HAZT_HAZT000982 [Hyalella azteca]|uniref:RGS domain-containing protein n=1 Tax=Hyalella azteca TaxID=294128 RepID=A0A6A0GVW7_HYAAZ|nr:hypothetical protein HAZT_HAZT000982 [Hyalella azteca]